MGFFITACIILLIIRLFRKLCEETPGSVSQSTAYSRASEDQSIVYSKASGCGKGSVEEELSDWTFQDLYDRLDLLYNDDNGDEMFEEAVALYVKLMGRRSRRNDLVPQCILDNYDL